MGDATGKDAKAMLIRFAVSNFLSFDGREELSLEAGKARKHGERVYSNRRLKLVKCEALFGANASGKSNVVEAMSFVQDMVEDGFPLGFSNRYYRLNESNRQKPSVFEIEFLCQDKRFCYGFSTILNQGRITEEWLYEITPSGLQKSLYSRNVNDEVFAVGDFFRKKESVSKLMIYGEDSVSDHEHLFLTIINKSKSRMYTNLSELQILKDIFSWFVVYLNISRPDEILTGYPYFQDSNLHEIAELLSALGTGVKELKIVEVPKETVKAKIPEDLYNRIISNLEKDNANLKKKGEGKKPSIVARTYKEFYTFEIDENDEICIRTIEFSHEVENVYFGLQEESDGTARLLDLIEILFKVSNGRVFVIDEIDRCLHPAMTTKVISLFLTMAQGRNTQLIITTHESRLLKDDLLRNDEISFMLKTKAGSTIIKSLEKYQLRSDKKIYEALFDGTIEAIPQFNNELLERITSTNLQ